MEDTVRDVRWGTLGAKETIKSSMEQIPAGPLYLWKLLVSRLALGPVGVMYSHEFIHNTQALDPAITDKRSFFAPT